jgi:aspartate aminotransferase-like enzyme
LCWIYTINTPICNKADNFDLHVSGVTEESGLDVPYRDCLAPTHAILAFKRALDELEAEGGVQGRAKRFVVDSLNEQLRDLSRCRYGNNNTRIRSVMQSLGFKELIKPEYQTYIITSYYYPPAPFHFETFYNKLSEKSRTSADDSPSKMNRKLFQIN